MKTVQAPFRSGIDIEDYQLDPVVRAVQMPRVIRAILTELKDAIAGELDEPAYQQGYLPGMEPDEVEQFRRNKEAMRARLKEIPVEIERETAAIQARYANPQARLFPVAVTSWFPRNWQGVDDGDSDQPEVFKLRLRRNTDSRPKDPDFRGSRLGLAVRDRRGDSRDH